jgi:hypothetical protein
VASTEKKLEEIYELAAWASPPALRAAESSLRSAIHDKAVGHVYGSDNSELPSLGSDLELYGHWASVVSTIYTKLYQISQFDPSTVEYDIDSFTALRRSFSTSPFWNTRFSVVSHDVAISPQNYLPVIETIDTFVHRIGIAQDIKHLIIKNVKQVAELASKPSEPDGPLQKRSMLHNATLAVTSQNLHVMLLYAQVSMEMDQPKGRYRVIPQTIKIVLGHGALDFDFCKRHASSILEWDRRSVEEWEGEAAANHEPENTSEGWRDVEEWEGEAAGPHRSSA